MIEESTPIQTLIVGAKAAQQRLVDDPKVESNAPFEPPAELGALKNRLMGYIKSDSVHEEKEPTPDSLDLVQWRMVSENPADALLPPHMISKSPETEFQFLTQTAQEARTKGLQEQADKCIEDTQRVYLRLMINEVQQFKSHGYLAVHDWTKRPEELNAMIIELHNYGKGKDPLYGEEENISETIGIAFQVLRADSGGGGYSDAKASWRGIEGGLRYDDVATEILHKLKVRVKKIHQAGLDVCVMAALSCGDPFTAVKLIQMADQFLPVQGESARVGALSRLAGLYGKSSFQKAYELYPLSAKDRLDGVLASLGEGKFASFAEITQAQDLKQETEKRLRDRLKRDRDRWYASQQVTRTDLREQELDNQHLTDVVEQTIKDDKGWVAIEKIIKEKATRVVDGQAANLIAAELQRRIHPELTLDTQVKAYKAVAIKQSANKLGYGTLNGYGYNFYGYDLVGKDASTSDKQRKIENIYYEGDRDLQEELFNPNKIGIKALIALLRYPDTYVYQVKTAINNYEREGRKHVGELLGRFNTTC